jgi:hypothetical protein
MLNRKVTELELLVRISKREINIRKLTKYPRIFFLILLIWGFVPKMPIVFCWFSWQYSHPSHPVSWYVTMNCIFWIHKAHLNARHCVKSPKKFHQSHWLIFQLSHHDGLVGLIWQTFQIYFIIVYWTKTKSKGEGRVFTI